MNYKIARTMSTQHPDNARQPFFCENSVMGGDDEVTEAYYAFSHLKAEEQLWDIEGKEVDNFVVKKLFSKYENFFKDNVLGKDFTLTLRVPNPDEEKAEAKLLLEALESIPRSHDIAKLFYGKDVSPIAEVYQPMTTNAKSLLRIAEYYKKYVVGKANNSLIPNDITIKEWCGEFLPEKIRVTPLFETKESLLSVNDIITEYMQKEKINDYMRVWLARSDPALNYGSFPTIILLKIVLQRLAKLEETSGVKIYPMLGVGSAPFRGNLKPSNVDTIMDGYPSVQTFTVQSAFKYDNPEDEVRKGMEKLNSRKQAKPKYIDEKKGMEIFNKVSEEYLKIITELAPTINDFSAFVPKRRKRKLHIGLFGYSRANAGMKLPRAITFCASLYSLGLPPEIFGLNVVTKNDLEAIGVSYENAKSDFKDAAQFFNKDNLSFFPIGVQKKIQKSLELFDFEPNDEHNAVTSQILNDYKHMRTTSISEKVIKAAHIRRFLG